MRTIRRSGWKVRSDAMARVRRLRRAVHSACEILEQRQLLTDSSFVAVADTTQNFGDTRRAISYYDVTNVPTAADGTVFNQNPAFSVWPGFENSVSRDREEISAMAVNPANGDTYILAFDSGTPGGTDSSTGDGTGDYDLYRVNFTALYNDYVTNHRPRGIMYAPQVSTDGLDYLATYGSNYPAIDSTALGMPDARDNTDGDTTNDVVFLPGIIEKIGEVARYGASGASPFFNQQDLQFVDSNTLLLMENKPLDIQTGTLNQDYSIRTLERVSTSPGNAVTLPGDQGGTNHQTTESWESFTWSGDNFVDMDNVGNITDPNAPRDLSEVDGMRYVDRDGVKGVWVSERDGGGDDFSFFKLDFANRIAQKQELKVGSSPFAKAFALDEDPVNNPNANNGNVSFFDTDPNGQLVIAVNRSFDVPAAEPVVVTRDITNYNGGDSDSSGVSEVLPGGWNVSAALAPILDDDPDVTNSSFGVYMPSQNAVYYFDTDSGAAPNVVGDVYVVDATTGAMIYQELNAANHFFQDANSIRAFTIDTTAPSVVPNSFQFFYNTPPQAFQFQMSESVYSSLQLSDVSVENLTTSTTANPTSFSYNFSTNTITFRYSSQLADGNYRVTLSSGSLADPSGNSLAGTSTFDFFVLGGDANHDRTVDGSDIYIFSQYWLTPSNNYSQGDFNYDGTVDARDLGIIALHWQQTLDAPSPAPPLAPPIDSGATLPAPIMQPTGPAPKPTSPALQPASPAPQETVNLSDLTPTSVTNGYGAFEKDHSNGEAGAHDGHTIKLAGKSYAKGLGVHAGSTLVYNLAGKYTQFTSDIGVDDEVGNNGSVVFQVFADNVKIYDSGLMKGNTATKSIKLDVTGRKQLKLVVTDGGNGKSYDHADWAGAQLLGPLTTPATPLATNSSTLKTTKTANLISTVPV